MLFTRSMHLATAILSITSTALAIRVQPRHDGRSHQGAHDAAAPQLRQRQVNGPAVGIEPQSPDTALPLVSTPTDTLVASGTLTLTSTVPFDYAASSPPTTVAQVTNALSTGEGTLYIFPSSVIQIPIATICPDTPPIFPNATVGSGFVNATALLPHGSSTVYLSSSHPTNVSSIDPSNYTPVPLPSPISVCDPATDPSCTSGPTENTSVFSPTPIPLPSANTNGTGGNAAEERVIPDPTARILLDGNGCQTIYSPSYAAVCKTTVMMVGMPEATVTECDQWVTFSSDVGGCYGEAVATGSAGGDAARGAGDDRGDDGYRGSTTGISTTAPGITPAAGATLPTMTVQPGTYYAAHWVDVARGGVPPNVRVEECQGAPVTCQTWKERWSESKITGVVVQESFASFVGPAILTTDSSTITTTLSISSTVTKTMTTVSATVARERLGGEAAVSTSESSVVSSGTAQEVPPQVTIQLVKVQSTVAAAGAAPTTAMTMESVPASAIQSQSQGVGVGRDGQKEKDTEDVGGDGSGSDSGSGNVEMQDTEEGDGNEADVGNGLGEDDEGVGEDEGEGEDQGEAEKEEPQDGVITMTVQETHTSTHLVYETRTMAP